MAYATIAQVRDYVAENPGFGTGYDTTDAAITATLDMATNWINSYCGSSFSPAPLQVQAACVLVAAASLVGHLCIHTEAPDMLTPLRDFTARASAILT